ncbi:MAG: EF2563 family selenium-dependent molybdenum hydroxylase system protein [Anaerolineae bacterium]|nr:MAG: EF2563 family selenium-dependent molybdenum hydroxylase system protein [Anaerolineae bacterium]
MNSIVLLRGGGDLATGVAARLHRAGLSVLITELPEPLVVRRMASFAQAVFSGSHTVQGLTARRATDLTAALDILASGELPILIDPDLMCLPALRPAVLVDARLAKRASIAGMDAAPLVIGLGPGFTAGQDCHAVVETQRGHNLGRVYWEGRAATDTGVPESVGGRGAERVLRAPAAGKLIAHAAIGDLLDEGAPIAEAGGQVITAPFPGVLRGLLFPGLHVEPGAKIGDLDPRSDPAYCTSISDKALAIGGGVLEAVLTRLAIRALLYNAHAPD